MKLLSTILFLLTFAGAKGQVVIGRIMDKKLNEPINYLSVSINEGRKGCFPDGNGYFKIRINSADTLKISGIGFPTYCINNITVNSDTINLGELQIVESGFEGYATIRTKKGRSICRYVNNTKDIYKEDLNVVCKDHSIRFTWVLKDEKNVFIDFLNIQTCQ